MTYCATRNTSGSMQRRSMNIVGANVADRTVDLAFSSEAEVPRWFGFEILSHAAGACDLSRLNDGGAVLDGHDWSRHIGVVVRAWIGDDYVGRATVRLSKSAAASELLQDIADGIKRHVSVGYFVLADKHVGKRDGADVMLVTRWQPYEISFVSIPADTTVGVGRSADSAAPIIPRNDTRMTDLSKAVLRTLEDAGKSQPFLALTAPGFTEPTNYVPAPLGRSMVAVLATSKLPALFDKSGNVVRVPKGSPAGVTTTASAAIIATSLVARAGANVVICDDPDTAHVIGPTGAVAMESVPTQFRVIEPAEFSVVDVNAGDELPVSSLPTLAAPIDWKSGSVKQLGVRMEFTRSQLRRTDNQQLCDEIVASITLGIARAADKVLLDALDVATLQEYPSVHVAQSGVTNDELFTLVGGVPQQILAPFPTDQTARIRAELCPDIPGGVSIVGAFNRAGVAIRGDVPITWQRTGPAGGMAVTARVVLMPLVPSRKFFFRAAQDGSA